MEVCSMQDEVPATEPEGPLVAGSSYDQGQDPMGTVIPIGVKEDDGSFSESDDVLSSGPTSDDSSSTPNKKQKNSTSSEQPSDGESTVSSDSQSSGGEESASAISSPHQDKGKKKVRQRRSKPGLGDAQSSPSAAATVDSTEPADDKTGTPPEKGGSAPVPAVGEKEGEAEGDDNHASSSSSSSAAAPLLGRRNSAPDVAKEETKRLRIPLLGRRLRLDIKFGHQVVHKEPKVDKHAEKERKRKQKEEEEAEKRREKEEAKDKKKSSASSGEAAEKESQVEGKQHDTNEADQHHHHNPFHFLTNLFHHHHHHHDQQHLASTDEHAAPKNNVSDEHAVVEPQTHSVAPKVEVAA